ncbi:hypothetical protein LCGC14_0132090 [marine sediment metagenome]|uniref:Polysaccharide biosynthesis protein C-terminal domain-containing protein n=1 Tax=marine sediment metagenome TaxID=412755 RepID=A0A0F9Y5B4_9ZZZZ|nr:lipid II flippase MurJ [Maribacter sp.]HDZ03945.1 virulence factor MviN [Maribacter sp.]HEC39445.1 virulence factor MviN [bacterium]
MLKTKLTELVKNIFKKQSQLVTNIIIVGSVSLAVKGVSFYKELLIAENYGVSELLDTFLIAVLIPTFIQNVFINAYGSVFIPNYLLEKKNNENTGAFQSSSFLITIGIGLLMILVTYLFLDFYLEFLFPGHETTYYQLIKIQLWIILPSMLFWAITSLISGLLMTNDEFLYSSLNAIFIPIITIFFLFFYRDNLQEKTLAVGILVGSIISTFYMVFIGFRKKLITIKKPDFKNANIQLLLKQMPAKISSGLINGVNPMVDQYFSAQMAIGAIAALNYGYKIPMVIISLVGGPIGSTILPHFSKIAAENSEKAYQELKKILHIGLISMSGVTIILIFLSEFIIIMFFQRGAFTQDDTSLVYVIQQMYFIQIPFYIVGIVMNSYLTAVNKNNFLVISSILSMTLNIILNYTLIELLGIKGLALATSLVSFINSFVIYIYIRKQYSIKNNV